MSMRHIFVNGDNKKDLEIVGCVKVKKADVL